MNITETKDIKRIQSLASKCYLEAYKGIHTEEQNRFSFREMYSTKSLNEQIDCQHSCFFILSDKGQDCGYMSIYPISDGVWMIDKLYLIPQRKGHGYGRIMVDYAIQYILQSATGFCQLVLNVNRRNEAVAFYQHLGFEIANSWDKEIADGKWIMDGYEMRKTIRGIV